MSLKRQQRYNNFNRRHPILATPVLLTENPVVAKCDLIDNIIPQICLQKHFIIFREAADCNCDIYCFEMKGGN